MAFVTATILVAWMGDAIPNWIIPAAGKSIDQLMGMSYAQVSFIFFEARRYQQRTMIGA